MKLTVPNSFGISKSTQRQQRNIGITFNSEYHGTTGSLDLHTNAQKSPTTTLEHNRRPHATTPRATFLRTTHRQSRFRSLSNCRPAQETAAWGREPQERRSVHNLHVAANITQQRRRNIVANPNMSARGVCAMWSRVTHSMPHSAHCAASSSSWSQLPAYLAQVFGPLKTGKRRDVRGANRKREPHLSPCTGLTSSRESGGRMSQPRTRPGT